MHGEAGRFVIRVFFDLIYFETIGAIGAENLQILADGGRRDKNREYDGGNAVMGEVIA